MNNLIHRHHRNPILKAEDVPYHATLTFNAGVTKYKGVYVMVFRNDYGDESTRKLHGTNLGLAYSDDGVHWEVQPKPCFQLSDEHIICVNDPRLTIINDLCYITFAVITRQGVRGGLAVTDNFKDFKILDITLPDNRNLVLFPEKINNKYIRLERPFSLYMNSSERFDIWLSESHDLRYWGDSRLVLKSESVPYCNNRIGAGAPPIKTKHGWLAIFHAVSRYAETIYNGWEGTWNKEYVAGVMLLDLENPSKVKALADRPLITPEASYELHGFRGNVVFPGGCVLEEDGEVKIYYGAADTVEALITTNLDDLIEFTLTNSLIK